jgi:hypothetical protein
MKKQFLLFSLLLAFCSIIVVGQATTPVNVGGNMEDETPWNPYWNIFGAKDVGTYEFYYIDDRPAAGEGGCYRVTGSGQCANMLWQPVEIIPGHSYYLTGAYKYLADTSINVWVEYFLTPIKPAGGAGDVNGEIATGWGYSMNTWMGVDLKFDGTFQDDFRLANVDSVVFVIPDTITQTEWYLCMKAGCWNDFGTTEPHFDVLFDEIYMYDYGVPPTAIGEEKIAVANTSINFKVYPNPSQGIVNIESIDNLGTNINIVVYSITGSVIATDVFTERYALELTTGFYIVQLRSEGQVFTTKVLIH